jgi:hypothetical protein
MEAGAGGEALRAQAQHLWQFLDDLAARDPAAYQQFVQRRFEEAATFLPQPAFAVRAPVAARETDAGRGGGLRLSGEDAFRAHLVVAGRSEGKGEEAEWRELFVNFCCAEQVPQPQLSDGRPAQPDTPPDKVVVPLSVGIVRTQSNGDRTCDVVVHPEAARRCERDLAFKFFLVELGVSQVEQNHKLRLSRAYKLLEERYHGSGPPKRQFTEQAAARLAEPAPELVLGPDAAPAAPPPKIALPALPSKPAAPASSPSSPTLTAPAATRASKGRPLIAELASSEDAPDESEATRTPAFIVEESAESVAIVVSLPGVVSSGARLRFRFRRPSRAALRRNPWQASS